MQVIDFLPTISKKTKFLETTFLKSFEEKWAHFATWKMSETLLKIFISASLLLPLFPSVSLSLFCPLAILRKMNAHFIVLVKFKNSQAFDHFLKFVWPILRPAPSCRHKSSSLLLFSWLCAAFLESSSRSAPGAGSGDRSPSLDRVLNWKRPGLFLFYPANAGGLPDYLHCHHC